MRKLLLAAFLFLVGLEQVHGQTQNALPSVLVAAGGGYNAAGSPKVGGWVTLAMRVGTTNTFSYTTIRTAALGTSYTTGGGVCVWSTSDGLGHLCGIADAGVTTTNVGGLGGSFSSGAVFDYRLDGVLKSPGWHLLLDARVGKVTNAGTMQLTVVQPIVMIGIGYAFK